MKVTSTYTSIGCNRTPECADWGYDGLIVYGACNAIVIFDANYDGESAKVLQTHVQHKKRVNTVRWLRNKNVSGKHCVLSGADDGLVIFWCLDEQYKEPTHVMIEAHTAGVYAVDGLELSDDCYLLATTAADSTIKLWHLQQNNYTLMQTITLNTGFSFAVRLLQLPDAEKSILMAFSSDDETVALWAQTAASTNEQCKLREFNQAHKLKGHEDWVRGLDFVTQGDDLLLASAGQDNFIRLWRIARRNETQLLENKVDIMDAANVDELRVEEKIVALGKELWYAISLESVLFGHEAWVYGVHWHNCEQMGLRLLSASMDKSLIIWQANEDGIWLEQVRVGEVGGNSLGFFGGKFSADGKSIMGHSYQGGFHIWTQSQELSHVWQPNVVVGGHFAEVRDLSWEPDGQYLMSVSADQTTRVHAPWYRVDKQITWHEIARPQVHGYDMQALAILSRYKFASGAEEKIVRTFQAPLNFIENFRRLTLVTDDKEGDALLDKLPKGASVPSLGLSNKAVYTEQNEIAASNKHVKDAYPEHYFAAIVLETPPQEETLMQNTLWPELQKLYGHGYEIYALTTNADGTLLASSCRSTNAEHAQIILWSTATWKQIQKLASHQLTVTQMRFSPNGRYLLSVSRDRRWSLFEREDNSDNAAQAHFTLKAVTDKTNGVHTRIIWSCDWASDSEKFVTSSRDGKLALWSKSNAADTTTSLQGWTAVAVLELKQESMTAVAYAPHVSVINFDVIAVGFESGQIHIYKYMNTDWTLLKKLNNDQAHHLAVKRLQFRPIVCEQQSTLFLASCADDHMVRIHELSF